LAACAQAALMFSAIVPGTFFFALLALTPVVIHLLTRRRVQVRSFPALAFIAQVESGRSSRRRLRDILVLTLRALALALLVAAAAGLLWNGVLVGDAQRPAVIIVDGSASMRQIVSGSSAWSNARGSAGNLADKLSARPLAAIISGLPARRSGEPSHDHASVRSLLAEGEAGFGDGDPAGTIAAACALLPNGGDCFYITDLARGALAGVDPAALPAGVRLRVIKVDGGGGNCAIVGLSSEPGVAVAGMPVSIGVRVANFSAQPAQLSVNLRVGAKGKLFTVPLAPGASATVQESMTFDSSGWVPISAEIAALGDALSCDDRRDGSLEVVPAITALLASDGDLDDQAGAVRPLHAALSAARLSPRVTDSSGLRDALAAGGITMVVTAELKNPEVVAALLPSYLKSGGAWLQVIASDADALMSDIADIAPPARLGARMDVSAQERGQMAVSQAKLDHPLLAPFLGREALLTSLAAYRYRLTPGGSAADAAVILAYGDGTIALSERPAGAGRWLQLNCSPALADSNLGSGEVLPLLIAQLPAVLLPPRNEHLSRDVGASVAAATALHDAEGHALAAVDGHARLPRPGLFRQDGGALVGAAVPALESDLRQLDAAVLELPVTTAQTATSDTTRTPLWPWLLVAALAALAAEIVLAGNLSGTALLRKRA
jgi:hypothetical protein